MLKLISLLMWCLVAGAIVGATQALMHDDVIGARVIATGGLVLAVCAAALDICRWLAGVMGR